MVQSTSLSTADANRRESSIEETTDENVEADREQIQSLLESIRELTNAMGEDVGRHSTTLEEVTATLHSAGEIPSSAILEATTRILEANKDLQTDLANARAEIATQREQLGAMATQALTDPLTGLDNRRSLDQELKRQVARVNRHGSHVCVVMIDLDHFKKVNDRFGHLIGDELLRTVSGLIKRVMRDGDFVARYGGEEFACILPNTSLEDSQIPAERIRCEIAAHSMKVGNANVSPTVSIGISECTAGDTVEQFVHRADQALYAAKGSGRNCCSFHNGQRIWQIEMGILHPAKMDQHADMSGVTA
ncbi:MAG: GGDEF domain-containing protein [Planctomycetales bacterium]|nr:GGDEF domain-containing protein [Planctomycetales bacterium]